MHRDFDREGERATAILQLSDAPRELRSQLMCEYQQRSEAAFAPSTLRNYRQIILRFEQWCRDREMNAVPPISPKVVAAYIDDLGGKIRPTTIETRLWAISELHRSHFLPNPCRHRLVELALMGVKRKYGVAVRQATALGKVEILGSGPIKRVDAEFL